MGLNGEQSMAVAEKTLVRDMMKGMSKTGEKLDQGRKQMMADLFKMALPKTNDAFKSEFPRQEVRLRPYLLAQNELSNKDWRRLLRRKPTTSQKDRYPHTGIGRRQIQGVLKRSKSGLRLPSESEWEYGCRSGTQSFTYWGKDDFDMDHCQIDVEDKARNHETRGPRLKCNAFGLYNMVGNVSEWVADDYLATLKGIQKNGRPYRKQGAKWGVIRGASARSIRVLDCRSSFRQKFSLARQAPNAQLEFLGCRLAKSIPGF